MHGMEHDENPLKKTKIIQTTTAYLSRIGASLGRKHQDTILVPLSFRKAATPERKEKNIDIAPSRGRNSAALDAAFATLGAAFAALLAHEATAQGRQTALETALVPTILTRWRLLLVLHWRLRRIVSLRLGRAICLGIAPSQQAKPWHRAEADSRRPRQWTYRLGVLGLRVALVALRRGRGATLIVLCSRHGTV